MKVYYRTSDVGYKKEKLDAVNFQTCFVNFWSVFGQLKLSDLTIVTDNVTDESYGKIQQSINQIAPQVNYRRTYGNSSAGGVRETLKLALDEVTDPEEIIFFVENDYIFRRGSYDALLDGFDLGADIVTLYTHPDKFIPASKGGNPLVGEDGAQVTKVFRGKTAYWMLTDSTTCTWATKLKTLKEIVPIIRPFISETYPRDMDYFHELRRLGYSLIQPLPTFSTHAEKLWLSPLIGTEFSHLSENDGWDKILKII